MRPAYERKSVGSKINDENPENQENRRIGGESGLEYKI